MAVATIVVTASELKASAAGTTTATATRTSRVEAQETDTTHATATGDGASPLARFAFNRHRQLMVKHKLPRDPRDGKIKGAMIASWSWIGFPQSSPQSEQLWHVQAVKNNSVEYVVF
jgi:hypothetical protein